MQEIAHKNLSIELNGKTIQQVITSSVNCITLIFTTGEKYTLWCHHDFTGVDFYTVDRERKRKRLSKEH